MAEYSRRRFLTQTSLGVAGLAALAAIPAAAPLEATRMRPSTAPKIAAAAEHDSDLGALGEDVVAHVRDASTGEIAVLVGGTERIHHDPALVARLLGVARQARTDA